MRPNKTTTLLSRPTARLTGWLSRVTPVWVACVRAWAATRAGSEECHLRRQLLFGSSASRSPSPKRLKAMIVMKMASPGMIMYIGSTE